MVRRNGRSRVPAEEPAAGDGSTDPATDPATDAVAASSDADTPAGPAGTLVEDLAPAGRRADDAPADAPDTLSGLLAALGRHLESHAPDEVVVLLREEMERRELRAYSSGWRDAAAHYEPALQEARAAGGRALRLVRGVPGQAAVIPLRQQDRDAADRHADDRNREGGGADGRTARPGPAADGERGDRPQGPAPALVPKSRTSRVPTIPRLRPPSRRPAGGTAPVTPDGESL
ncbi:hypothetical protein C5F59_015895 [Streptomyces sp. QL37]|uniref:hypothetical protein n=1 Tax=Streptomyces sp. QL37 TaxID=2093747 RepID=UPI0011B04F56|nr:hypothetical protein [Streptomyces sp. QL37]